MRAALRVPFLLALPALTATALSPAQSPAIATAAFGNASVVYDQARQRLVAGLPSRALWEWDGANWALSSAELPAAPSRALYDPVRARCYFTCAGRLVEFDGHAAIDRGALPVISTSNIAVDTYRGRLLACQTISGAVAAFEWDGTGWQAIPSPGPSTSTLALAYDEARRCAVLQSLQVSGSVVISTWEWDGISWALRATGTRAYAPLRFDLQSQQLVTMTNSQNFAWTGSQWVPAGGPAPATGTPTNDPANGLTYVYSTTDRRRFWAWDGTNWSVRTQVPHPIGPPGIPRLVYDSVRDRAIVVEGSSQLVHAEWDGSRWFDVPTAGGPSARYGHAMAFDAARGTLVLFGGATLTGNLADTWTWNGTQWQLAATTGPAARANAAMTYDSLRQRIVMIGGDFGLSDHWEWDGLQWTQVSATTPMGTNRAALGHDPVRDVLLHVDPSGTTYEKNQTGWLVRTTANPSLGSAGFCSLTWDPVRQRLQGELNTPSGTVLHEWTGTNWQSRGTSFGSTAWDSRRGALLGYAAQQFVVGSPTPATVQDFGTPCGGSTTTTSLSAFGKPRPGDSTFHLDVRAEASLRPALIGYASAAGNTPIGNGCTLLLQSPFGSTVWFTDANGFWHHPFPLPNSLAIRGIALHTQAAVLDPATPGGIALTQGLLLTVGD